MTHILLHLTVVTISCSYLKLSELCIVGICNDVDYLNQSRKSERSITDSDIFVDSAHGHCRCIVPLGVLCMCVVKLCSMKDRRSVLTAVESRHERSLSSFCCDYSTGI